MELYLERLAKVSYPAIFGPKNEDIGSENSYFRDVY